MYNTSEYADSRIAGTVVLLKRKPVFVERVLRGKAIANTFDAKPRRLLCKVESLSVLSPNMSLGFYNNNGTAYYLSRKAMRNDWRQGLRPNNVLSIPYKEVSNSDIASCLLRRYPTFLQAIEKVAAGADSCAWCPDFCVKGKDIVWKTFTVGSIKDTTITLSIKFKFLHKLLKESTNECYEIV